MNITKEEYETLIEKVGRLEKAINGGKGSGNFGHLGRPGEVGGSGRGVAASDLHTKGESASKEQDGQTGGYSWDPETESFKDNGIDLDGEPKDIVNFSGELRSIVNDTGALSSYMNGEIYLGYDTKTEAPLFADSESDKEYKSLEAEYRQLNDDSHQLYKEREALVDSGQYLVDPSKPAGYGNDVRIYTTTEDILRSNMPQDKKDRYVELQAQSKKINERQGKIIDREVKIAENAKYHPNGLGPKSALLVTGLSKGIGNYTGQRSDGAGEGSFNDRVKWDVDRKAWAHKEFISALRNPSAYTTEQFNAYKTASAKLASSQASYLKRVENSIDEPNFMGSKEFAKTAKIIKSMTREQAIADKNIMKQYPGTYISFKDGIPEIVYKH